MGGVARNAPASGDASVVRLGVIGAGIMGDTVARRASTHPAFTVTAIADTDAIRAGMLAEELGAVAFSDFTALLASGLTDAVYIGVPHHLHLTACLQAAAAGMHVLVDKPLCNTEEEAEAIESAALESGTTWMVGFSYRFRAEWQRARELISAGRIGEPVAVIDVITEAAEKTPAWYWDPYNGGGVLQLQSHHCFDRITWLTNRQVREVNCSLYEPAASAATAAQITVGLEGGILAGIALSFGTNYPATVQALFVIQGTTGQLEITQDSRLTLSSSEGEILENYGGDDWLGRELAEFATAIHLGAASTATIADGRAALKCALAAARSAATGERVSVTA